MKKGIKLRGRLRNLIHTSVYMGVLLLFVDIALFIMDIRAGMLVAAFLLLYFCIVGVMIFHTRPILMNELISFATQYGQIQKRLLRELELPYALLDEAGKIVWTNLAFEKVVHKEKGYHKSITSLIPSITRDKLPTDIEDVELSVTYENRDYTAKMKLISLEELSLDSELLEEEETSPYLIAFYLFDETALKIALQEVDDQSLAIGLLYLDNYEEALESVDEVRRSLLVALIDRKVNQYISGLDGICKKMEKDKFLIILRKKAIANLQSSRFDLLEEVKTVNIGNEMAVTISIGVGLDGLSYAQNYEFARNAIDLALGRGGDQAVVKTPNDTVYYGGKSQQIEKNTRVKARVKAQALKEIISGKDMVLVMGHRNADIDSFGAAVGIARIAMTLGKEVHIVLSDSAAILKPFIDKFHGNPDYEDNFIINSHQAVEMVSNNAVLVVVDVNKPSITDCPELLRLCRSIVVFDHHRQGTEVIENATLSYVEGYASSTCEMVSEILQYIGESIKIKSLEADCMYSGIMIDTNNFMTKTGVRTFEAAAFLRRNGADVMRVRKLFREDAIAYKAKADAVSQAEIYKNAYAISICTSDELKSPTVVGAQAANELLNIKGIKASFVLTEYQGMIYVSARSIDEVNVQIIMERLGGGGHINTAGCQMEDTTLTEGISIIKHTLDKMIEEGAI